MPHLNNVIFNKRIIGIILLIILFGFGLTLICLPATFFDTGTSVCLSVVFFKIQCYGCGMTRGIMHLIHFNFAEAWAFNKLSFIVFPLLVYMIISEIYKRFLK
jgi:hypothetical protein